jgi:hypothetical protein
VEYKFRNEREFEDFIKAMRRRTPVVSFAAYTVDEGLQISVEWADGTEAIFALKPTQ